MSSVAVTVEMWKVTRLLIVLWGFGSSRSQLFQCHDDPSYTPDEGPLQDLQYTWLGTLQYIHVKKGHPHYFRVPRVVLISRQYVLSTAKDAAEIPEEYALGNVAFGEYERDELECGLTIESVEAGEGSSECTTAAILVPICDVMLHPEYTSTREADSIALLRMLVPIESQYMVPVCLPLKNYLINKSGKPTSAKIFHLDFSSDAPREIMIEEKEIKKLALLPTENCFWNGGDDNTADNEERIICTTGCNFHSGAPSMVHEDTGHWSIVALSQGGSPCPDPLRRGSQSSPPRHILVHSFVSWIMSAITGKLITGFDENDPFGFMMARTSVAYQSTAPFGHGWNGHWWNAGIACYNRGEESNFKFYHEVFQVKRTTDGMLTYMLEISAPYGLNVVCIKVGMPYHLASPTIQGLPSPDIKVRIPVVKFSRIFKFEVEAWAHNETESSSEESSDSDYDPDA